MKPVSILLITLLLIGCEAPARGVADRCVQEKVFKYCIKGLMKPEIAERINMAESIKACQYSSFMISLREHDQIKPSCRDAIRETGMMSQLRRWEI